MGCIEIATLQDWALKQGRLQGLFLPAPIEKINRNMGCIEITETIFLSVSIPD